MGDSTRVLSQPHKKLPQSFTKTNAKMTIEEIVAATIAEEEQAVVPQPDAGKKRRKAKKAKKAAKKGRKAAKKARKARKATKKTAKKARKSRRKAKKSNKKTAKKAKKMTKRQRRHARRAAAKRARGGRTIAQCVVACMKQMSKGSHTAAQVQRALAKKGIKVASFVLNKVILRLVRRRVVHSVKGALSLTGRRIPKAKKPRALRRNKKGRFMKAKKAAKKAGKKAKKARKSKKSAKKSRKTRRINVY